MPGRSPRPHAAPMKIALLAALVLPLPAQHAEAQRPPADGYEIRRQSSSPFLNQNARMLGPFRKAQCEQLVELCRMAPTADAPCTAEMLAEPYRLEGDLDLVGKGETVEYHLPAHQSSAVTTGRFELVEAAPCRHAVRKRETTVITRHTAAGRVSYVRRIDPVRGAQPWRREPGPALGRETATLARRALALDSFLPPGLRAAGDDATPQADRPPARFAGLECRWRETTLPGGQGRSCIASAVPGIGTALELAREIVLNGADGPVTFLSEQAASLRGPIVLPAALFEPDGPVGDPGSAPNATTAWCAAEAARSGTNPCEDED